jgi:hypothetical protein
MNLQILSVVKPRILESQWLSIKPLYILRFGVRIFTGPFYFTTGHTTLYYSRIVILTVIKVRTPTSQYDDRVAKESTSLNWKRDAGAQASSRMAGADVYNYS